MIISVIIPVYNAAFTLRETLESVVRANPDEIIVVADGDTDGSRKIAQGFDRVRVIELTRKSGAAAARNAGAEAARGDVLFFVDSDVTIPADTVERVRAIFSADPSLTALIGSYDDAPAGDGFLSQYRNLMHHYVHQISNPDASTFWSGCGAVRREAFRSVGGFDASIRMMEDIDLGYRLKLAGARIRLEASLQVKHHKTYSPLGLIHADFFNRALPWTELLYRYRNFTADLNLTQSSRVSVTLAFLLVGLLIASLFVPALLIPALASAAALLIINHAFYAWFGRKRGVLFMLRVIPWHWLYFLYGGAGFALGTLRYWLSRPDTQPAPLPRTLDAAE